MSAQEAAEAHRSIHEGLVARLQGVEDAEVKRVAAYRSAQTSYKKYRDSIAEAQEAGARCRQTKQAEDSTLALHAYLAEFTSEPERDAAMTALESCRKLLLKERREMIQDAAVQMRKDFAVEIEDAFDENNPYDRGKLVATVKGDTLVVKMRGNFEGRRRHSQDQVDDWCTGSIAFSKITLHNSHGTFFCVPDESPKEVAERFLRDAGILDSWLIAAVGSTVIPESPVPPPPANGPEKLQLSEQAAASKLLLDTETARETKAAESSREATELVRDIDAREKLRIEVWQQDEMDTAKKVQTIGIATGAVGIGLTALGAYLGYARSDTTVALKDAEDLQALGLMNDKEELADKLSRQTTGMVLGLSVGIPLIVTGAVLFIVGKQRKANARNLSLAPGGLRLQF